MRARAADGCSLWCNIAGDGPPAIFIAGFGGTAGYWEPQTEFQRRFSMLLFDQRGTGRSDPQRSESLDQLTDDVVAVLDHCKVERAHVIGHSLGGSIALRLAARYRQRVAGLVVYAARARGDALREKIFALRRSIYRQLGPAAHASFTSLLLYPPQFIAGHGDEVAAGERQSVLNQMDVDVFESRVDVVLKNDNSADLGKIAARTLVLCAGDDLLTPPACSQEIAAAIRGSTLHLLPAGGHAASRTNAALFNAAVLEFLDSFEATAANFSESA